MHDEQLPPLIPAQRVAEVPGLEVRLCSLLAVDIKGFGDKKRGEDIQHYLRQALYQLVSESVAASRLSWAQCRREDRGDGIFVIAPEGAPSALLIDPLVDHLRAGLRQHNKIVGEVARIQLRMAVHTGYVWFDQYGVGGDAVIYLFRMLDAVAFKRKFAESGADFGLLASNELYDSVIKPGTGLIDPAMYAPLKFRNKEIRGSAWLFLPPVSNPFLCSTPRQRRGAQVSELGQTGYPKPVPCSGRPQRSAGSR